MGGNVWRSVIGQCSTSICFLLTCPPKWVKLSTCLQTILIPKLTPCHIWVTLILVLNLRSFVIHCLPHGKVRLAYVTLVRCGLTQAQSFPFCLWSQTLSSQSLPCASFPLAQCCSSAWCSFRIYFFLKLGRFGQG